MITQEWLVDNLGQPSGKWGSTYTKIHKKTGEYERTPTLALLEQLIELVNDFSWSAHKGAKTDEQREAKALDAIRLNQFLVALKTERLGAYGLNSNYTPATLAARIKKGDTQYATEKAMVQSVIAEMQQSSSPVIRNTGIGCASSDVTLSMIWHASRSGSMSLNGLLEINALTAYNKLNLIGLLVHEYHHFLCGHNGQGDVTYLDEFVAHWKEFEITKGRPSTAQARADEVNAKLGSLYTDVTTRWQRHHQLLNDIAQAGDFAVPDNGARKPVSRSQHGAIPVA